MISLRMVRWGTVGAAITGIAWMLSGIVIFVFAGQGDGDPTGELSFYLYEGVHTVAWMGMLVALLGFYFRQAPRHGRLGTAGFLAAFGATALMILVTVWWLIAADEAPSILNLFWGLVLLGWIVGFTLLGVATSRAKVLPRWCGLLLFAYVPLGFFAGQRNDIGGILVGLLWLALSYTLWRWRDVPAGQPSLVGTPAHEDVGL